MQATPDIYLDKITLGGVSTIAVDQGGGNFAFVQHSTTVNRMFQLRGGDLSDSKTKITRRRLWMLDNIPAGLVWCSGCGDWHLPSEFSPDKRNRNGLQSHCKTCRNKHSQMMYAKQKYDGAFLKKTITYQKVPSVN